MSTLWMVWPQEGHAGAAILGGKGTTLWTLWQHDMPIPPTCCVTVAAHQAWLQAGKPERLPASLADLLTGALQRPSEQGHGVARFAVRSSAVPEDGQEASFAGQLRTLLNVSVDGEPDGRVI